MPKIQRKSAKIFAEQAQAGVGGVGQFGSLAAGAPQYSKDVDVIQALDAYKNGWSDAVVGNKSPAIEDRNALDYLLSYQQAYIMQQGVPEWLSTETYYKNCYVVDSNGQLRYSLTDNNSNHNPVDDNLGQLYWGFGGARGTGKSVGEVYLSQSNLSTDNPGSLPLWTGELISNANNLYPQFYSWLSSHSSLCVTQYEYDNKISQYGECPFYVLTETSIRLPKLVNYLKMASGSTLTQGEAGLPNITGSFSAVRRGDGEGPSPTGSFSRQSNWNARNGVGGSDDYGSVYGFDASNSNSTYGNSTTVTPAYTTLYPWVYVYNQAVAASTAQAAEFQEALSSKADTDFVNVGVSGKQEVISWNMLDLSAGVSVSTGSFSPTTYGVLIGITNDQGGNLKVEYNSIVLAFAVTGTNYTDRSSFCIPVEPDLTYTVTASNGTLTFYPYKGAN